MHAALPLYRELSDLLTKWDQAITAGTNAPTPIPSADLEQLPERELKVSQAPPRLAFEVDLPPDAFAGGDLNSLPSTRPDSIDPNRPLGYIFAISGQRWQRSMASGAFPVLAVDNAEQQITVGGWQRNPHFHGEAHPWAEAQATIAALRSANPGYQVNVRDDQPPPPKHLPIPKVGLNTKPVAERFSDSIIRLFDEGWTTLDPAARVNEIKNIIDDTLDSANVPRVRVTAESLGPDTNGSFKGSTWTIKLDQKGRVAANSKAALTRLATTLFHEMFHAYQWFAMARMLAGLDRPASEIAATLSIPMEVVKQAQDNKLLPVDVETAAEYDAAVWWFVNEYATPFREHRKRVLRLRPDWAAAGLQMADNTYRATDGKPRPERLRLEEVRRSRAHRDRTNAAYRAWPIEHDAHEVPRLLQFPQDWLQEQLVGPSDGLAISSGGGIGHR